MRESSIRSIKIKKEDYLKTAKKLKEEGFDRLLTVSAIDFPEKNLFEVYFIVYSKEKKEYLKVSTEISRDDPILPSISKIWKNAENHERETSEMFGIKFEGLSKENLFLEDWEGPPPFRKDFNWRKYVKEAYDLG